MRIEHIHDATLYLGDCLEILPMLKVVDHIITDPPYSERTHAGHNAGTRPGIDGSEREQLGYGALSIDSVYALAKIFARICNGWIVWMTDHTLAPDIGAALANEDRYVFAPVPYHHPGRSVRLAGDGPSSWTDWLIVARTSALCRWGTLRGGYVAGPGWDDKVHMGGKPTRLMQMVVMDYSHYGEIVCDPFMGSGTTGVACANLGRKFIGIEIEPKYFDIACKRIEVAYRQPRLFDEPKPEPVQGVLM